MKEYEYIEKYLENMTIPKDDSYSIHIVRSITHIKLMKMGFFFQGSLPNRSVIATNFKICKMPKFKIFKNYDEALLGTIAWVNSGVIAWS